MMTLALGLCSNVVGIALLWGLVQVGYVMLTVPMAAAFSSGCRQVPSAHRARAWHRPDGRPGAGRVDRRRLRRVRRAVYAVRHGRRGVPAGRHRAGAGVAEGTVERGAAAYGDECAHADGAVPRAAARRRILEGVRFALLGVGWCRTDDHVPVVHRIGADLPGLVHARQLLSDRGTGVLVDRLDGLGDARRLRGGPAFIAGPVGEYIGDPRYLSVISCVLYTVALALPMTMPSAVSMVLFALIGGFAFGLIDTFT